MQAIFSGSSVVDVRNIKRNCSALCVFSQCRRTSGHARIQSYGSYRSHYNRIDRQILTQQYCVAGMHDTPNNTFSRLNTARTNDIGCVLKINGIYFYPASNFCSTLEPIELGGGLNLQRTQKLSLPNIGVFRKANEIHISFETTLKSAMTSTFKNVE